MSSVTSRDHPSCVLKATTRTGLEYSPEMILPMMATFIGFRFISLHISAAKFTKVIEHEVNNGVVPERAWGE